MTKDRLKRALRRAKSDSVSTISQEIHDFNTIYQADSRGLHEVTIKVSFDGTISLWADIYRVKCDDLRKFDEKELQNPVFRCFHHQVKAKLLLFMFNLASLPDISLWKNSIKSATLVVNLLSEQAYRLVLRSENMKDQGTF